MGFLVLVLAVWLIHQKDALPGWQRDGWFASWQQWLADRSWCSGSACHLLMSVFAPALAALAVMWLLGGWFSGLLYHLLSLAVLLYALGRSHLDAGVEGYREDLEREDAQAAYHAATALNDDGHESEAENWQELHGEVLSTIAYRYFERYFPVIFWFVVAGAPVALLYRLAFLYREAQADAPRVGRLLWWLEWLPLRLLGIIIALVGNFSSAMQEWRASLWDSRRGAQWWVAEYARAALNLPATDVAAPALREGADEVTELRVLFDRALVLTLALIALLVLF